MSGDIVAAVLSRRHFYGGRCPPYRTATRRKQGTGTRRNYLIDTTIANSARINLQPV